MGRTIYLDCGMGAAGDMLTAALFELCPDQELALEKLNAMGIPGVEYRAEKTEKCGITGTHMHVLVHGEEEKAEDVWMEERADGEKAEVHEYMHGDGHEHGHEHEHSHGHGHSHEHEHEHSHEDGREHSHGHEHEHSHEDGHEHSHGHEHEHSHEDGHEHSHDHGHEHSHEDGYEHSHDHEHPHEHDHPHAHTHTHDHSGHTHHHAGMRDITQVIDGLQASDFVKDNAKAVYQLIAQAESQVHGRTVEQIHFHEVGTLDAVADVAGFCLLVEMLGPEKIAASPVHVGSGHVHCAHGILPVPAPATALLLQGIPIYSGSVRGELCTPTGAALLKHFASVFCPMPPMTVRQIGYGMGKKDFAMANCVRAFLGEEVGNAGAAGWNGMAQKQSVQEDQGKADQEKADQGKEGQGKVVQGETADKGTAQDEEHLVELRCNLDDMSGEDVGFVLELLLQEGALDAYTLAAGMKKSRPGLLLTCLCRTEDAGRMEDLILLHTTTLGVRRIDCRRRKLERRTEEVSTPWGTVRKKISEGVTTSGAPIHREKTEYEDLARICRETGMSLQELREKLTSLNQKKLDTVNALFGSVPATMTLEEAQEERLSKI